MGTYNDSVVEILDQENKVWHLADSDGAFPVRSCDWNIMGSKNTNRPFNYQSYAIASFIAGVRNYYALTPISDVRGLPDNESIEDIEKVSRYPWYIEDDCLNTWLLLKELLEFDYEQTFEDRRDNGNTVEKGKGCIITYREHLGEFFFDELEALKKFGNPEYVRIVFAFG